MPLKANLIGLILGGRLSPTVMIHSPLKTKAALVAKHSAAENAAMIHQYSVASANALWVAYDLARDSRGKPRGITTDPEQDILRAMLVAAASGLDGALKQLIRDALPTLIGKYDSVHSAFEKFTQKRIQVGEVDGTSGVSPKILAQILAAPDPQARLVEDYVYELTGDSLQSSEQLFKTCAALGADGQAAIGDAKTLKNVFDARNQIIHELDMNLDSPNRKRRVRSQKDMKEYSERLLGICHDIIHDVDEHLIA